MSRIRSIHPGIFTDEAFMGLSMGARLLLIGIWTEAFDDGVFRWKPLTLKARIFPVDAVDIPALLEELETADCIKHADDHVGLVRNFQRFQRPKKPNRSGMMRPEWGEYVGAGSAGGLADDDGGSEPVRNQFPTGSEKSSQMEDGGGNKEDEGDTPPKAPQGGGAGDLFGQVWEAFPRNPTSNEGRAEAVFRATKAKDQTAILAAAQRYSRWFTEECQRRKKPRDERLSFVPHLGTWIETGAWKEAASLPIKADAGAAVPMVRLDRVKDAGLWAACERIQGRAAPTSDNSWSFRAELVAEAKAMVLQ